MPYVVHPFEVAAILMEEGAAEEAVAAGLLHDTVEDTAVTAADIREKFGPRVEALVLACSEEKDLPWEERKGRMLARCEPARGRPCSSYARTSCPISAA